MSNRPWSDPELSDQAPGLLKRAWHAATEAERDEIRAIVAAEAGAPSIAGANDMHALVSPSTSVGRDAMRGASLFVALALAYTNGKRLPHSVADRTGSEITSLVAKIKNRVTE
jgi:hypothetical protein